MGDGRYSRLTGALLLSCGFFALVGLAVAFLGRPLLEPWRALMLEALYPNGLDDTSAAGMSGLMRLTEGILGGSIAGKWVATAWLVHVPLRRRERWAATAVLGSHLAWFAIDSAASVRAGAELNILVINLFPLLLVGGLTLALLPGTRVTPAPASPGLARRILTLVCAVSVLTGVVSAFAIRAWPFDLYNEGLAALYFAGEGGDWVRYQTFLYGLIGAAIAGHFIALTLALRGAPRARWPIVATVTSMCAWFFVDSTISVSEGAWFNVWMVNVPSFAAVMVVSLLAWREGRIEGD